MQKGRGALGPVSDVTVVHCEISAKSCICGLSIFGIQDPGWDLTPVEKPASKSHGLLHSHANQQGRRQCSCMAFQWHIPCMQSSGLSTSNAFSSKGAMIQADKL